MSSKDVQELKWIDLPKTTVRPPIDEFPRVGHRTFSSAVIEKSKENILVPIGLLATTACLTLGLVNMKQGNKKKQQLFMRGRIGFQLFTLGAMVFTMVYSLRRGNKATIVSDTK